jgi:hypothetical protein
VFEPTLNLATNAEFGICTGEILKMKEFKEIKNKQSLPSCNGLPPVISFLTGTWNLARLTFGNMM